MTDNNTRASQILFWGCFIALIATAFGFISRMTLIDTFQVDFNLDETTKGKLQGAGVWPFAISIILFSLIIDKIGYRVAMIFSFVCYVIFAIMAWMAYNAVHGATLVGQELIDAQAKGYSLLYWGSIILALGNGTVEAYINPIVATMFSKDKTKWLNILHAGWPGGLVISGLLVIGMGTDGPWINKILLILIPAVIFFVMLIKAHYPVNERVAAGHSYRGMIAEFGILAAIIAFGLVFLQLGEVFAWASWVPWALTGAAVLAIGVYTQSLGRLILFFLLIIMMPLAITEICTDGWITSLMAPVMGDSSTWVLVYTSAIMMVLRFFAGPIIHKFSPLGLLALSAGFAIIGLFSLSYAAGFMIFVAATLYGIGKTFFWPTMLGVVSEQCPKGGALTLNTMGGVGMLAAGVIGFPLIGMIQDRSVTDDIAEKHPELVAKITQEKKWIGIEYKSVVPEKVEALEKSSQESVSTIQAEASQGALRKITIFPMFMLVCYLILIFYFKSRGGYKAVDIEGEAT